MKYVFFTLVLMNLVYLGLQLFQQQEVKDMPATQQTQFNPQGQGVWLISEVPEKLVARDNQSLWQEVEQIRRETLSAQQDLCLEITGFSSERDFNQWQQNLNTRSLEVGVRRQESDGSAFWLYLPRLKSQAEAVAVIARLKDEGITAYLINDGNYAPGVSLGVVSSRQQVADLSARLQASGYGVEVEKSQYETALSLLVKGFTTEYTPARLEQDFAANDGSINFSEKNCKAVASLYQFN